MKCLSIKQPWAWLILNAGKDVENRTWNTFHRGRFLIHASKQVDHGAMMKYSHLLPKGVALPSGCVVGSVELHDVTQSVGGVSEWRQDTRFGYLLKDPKQFDNPIPLRGRMGFYEVNLEDQ